MKVRLYGDHQSIPFTVIEGVASVYFINRVQVCWMSVYNGTTNFGIKHLESDVEWLVKDSKLAVRLKDKEPIDCIYAQWSCIIIPLKQEEAQWYTKCSLNDKLCMLNGIERGRAWGVDCLERESLCSGGS